MKTLETEWPPKLIHLLFESTARYRIAYGGRGGCKSWGFARALLLKGMERTLRILCARETMQSIADSVHQLLQDQIEALGLGEFYNVQKASIIGINGTEFAFAGLKHNINQIKSYESFDIAWVEEAQSVSKTSWQVLIPTIRKEGSEIWVSFNPELETDDTYARFVKAPPPGAEVVRIGYEDNPWLTDVLKREIDHLRTVDPAAYAHVWGGQCVMHVEGAIYAEELSAADREQRITRVPYDPSRPVMTFWDLGYGDATAIWFCQAFPFEYRMIDFLEGERNGLNHYVKEIQSKPYTYVAHYLPHDAQAHSLGTGKSIEEQLRGLGWTVRIVPKLSILDGINAARTIFARTWFDGEKCSDGIQALRHYRWAPIGALGQIKREPLHDWASNPSDAFRYYAIGVKNPPAANNPARRVQQYQPVSAWS
jgi:phage terminase large subunit